MISVVRGWAATVLLATYGVPGLTQSDALERGESLVNSGVYADR